VLLSQDMPRSTSLSGVNPAPAVLWRSSTAGPSGSAGPRLFGEAGAHPLPSRQRARLVERCPPPRWGSIDPVHFTVPATVDDTPSLFDTPHATIPATSSPHPGLRHVQLVVADRLPTSGCDLTLVHIGGHLRPALSASRRESNVSIISTSTDVLAVPTGGGSLQVPARLHSEVTRVYGSRNIDTTV